MPIPRRNKPTPCNKESNANYAKNYDKIFKKAVIGREASSGWKDLKTAIRSKGIIFKAPE